MDIQTQEKRSNFEFFLQFYNDFPLILTFFERKLFCSPKDHLNIIALKANKSKNKQNGFFPKTFITRNKKFQLTVTNNLLFNLIFLL